MEIRSSGCYQCSGLADKKHFGCKKFRARPGDLSSPGRQWLELSLAGPLDALKAIRYSTLSMHSSLKPNGRGDRSYPLVPECYQDRSQSSSVGPVLIVGSRKAFEGLRKFSTIAIRYFLRRKIKRSFLRLLLIGEYRKKTKSISR